MTDQQTIIAQEALLRLERKELIQSSGRIVRINAYQARYNEINRRLKTLRSQIDFGEDPHNNPIYKAIRWERGAHETMGTKPMWLTDLNYQMSRKRSGHWDIRSAYHTRSFKGDRKGDTRRHFLNDITNCMRLGIPFKGKSFYYNHVDNWVYIKGIRCVKYNPIAGFIEGFTYGGVYDKLVAFFLRNLGVCIQKEKRSDRIWVTHRDSSIRLIDLTGYFKFEPFDYFAARISRWSTGFHLIIEVEAFTEYKNLPENEHIYNPANYYIPRNGPDPIIIPNVTLEQRLRQTRGQAQDFDGDVVLPQGITIQPVQPLREINLNITIPAPPPVPPVEL